jgi:hypothetical protein
MKGIGSVSRFALALGFALALTAAGGVLAKPAFVQDIGPGAAEPVRVVDEFSAAIRAAKLDQAAKLLDDKVLILESGGSERSRDQYSETYVAPDGRGGLWIHHVTLAPGFEYTDTQ